MNPFSYKRRKGETTSTAVAIRRPSEAKALKSSLSSTPPTILRQSTTVTSTHLLRDSRLPKKLDKVSSHSPRKSIFSRKGPASKGGGDDDKRHSLSRSSSLGSKSSNSMGSTTGASSNSNTLVYVRDSVYAWLPAQIQSSHDEYAVVKIVLPEDWAETTILKPNSTIKGIEYPSGENSIESPKPTLSRIKSSIGQGSRRIYKYERNEASFDGNIPKGIRRRIHYKDYLNSELPLQNNDRHPRRTSLSSTSTTTVTNPLMNARDMTDLPFLHEAAILYNIKFRNHMMLPYTRVGDIVVATNPFHWIDGLYSAEKQAIYAQHLIWDPKDGDVKEKTKSETKDDVNDDDDEQSTQSSKYSSVGSLPSPDEDTKYQPMAHDSFYSRLGLEPHIYETACLAYRGLCHEQQNQTIIVSGESGAGKTESVKLVMRNLATVEQTRPIFSNVVSSNNHGLVSSVSGLTSDIVQRVLESNPVFEAFGNAKTVRNDNSSRFGKFTSLQYHVESKAEAEMNGRSVPNCLLAGSFYSTYLLEKSRVVWHSPDERTYHIFYQLLSAPNNEKIGIWDGLDNKAIEDFRYVGTTTTNSIEGKSDGEIWKETVAALKLFSFVGNTFNELMRALCAVIQLGNLTFDSSADDGCTITSEEELEKLTRLMGISKENIISSMTTRKKTIRNDTITMRLNSSDAKDGCDAMAKAIYEGVFNVLVHQINEHTLAQMNFLHGSEESQRSHLSKHSFGTISLLDIFGFERFETNRFEQLCINYANERLQQRYVLDNFNAVKDEYTAEGIEVFDFSIVDNTDVVILLEGKNGLIAALNEECMRPKGTDKGFVYKAKTTHLGCVKLLSDPLHDDFEFGVKHFAGPVTYCSTNFLKSNTDLVPIDLQECASMSSNDLIGNEFTKQLSNNQQEQGSSHRRISKSSKHTVLAKFRSQLNMLMESISVTRTRYIRCIKPNERMVPRITDHFLTMNQLKYAGLITAITISRETFPNRLVYELVWERYRCLSLDDTLKGITMNKRSKNFLAELTVYVRSLLQELLVDPFIRSDGVAVPSFACGNTKVFFRTGALEHLERDRLEFYGVYATRIQKWIRKTLAQRRYATKRLASITVQRIFRGHVAQKTFKRIRTSLIPLQCLCRSIIAKRIVDERRRDRAATKIQTRWRIFEARKDFVSHRLATIMIQNLRRMICLRRIYVRQRSAAKMIQAVFIVFRIKKHCDAATVIQAVWRMALSRKNLVLQRSSVILIQATYRGYRQKMIYNAKLRAKNDQLIQSFPHLIVREEELRRRTGDDVIQKLWWMISSRKYLLKQIAATVIQASFRCYKQKLVYSRQVKAVIIIQSFCRLIIAREDRRERQLLNEAATIIQAIWRSLYRSMKYRRIKSSAIRIQRTFRLFAERRQTTAAVMIQKTWRSSSSRKQFIEQRIAATNIQALSRGHKQRKLYYTHLMVREQASLILQRFCRKIIAKHLAAIHRRRRNKFATIIQTAYRRSLARKAFLQQRSAATKIQASVRGHKQRKLYQSHLLLRETSSVIVQSLCRMVIAKRVGTELRRENEAATRIQSRWRASSSRKALAQQRSAATKIQALSRGHRQRKLYQSHLLLRKTSSVIVQSVIRMVIAKKIATELRRKHEAAIRIQSRWRTSSSRNSFVRKRLAATKIQAFSRGYRQRKLYLFTVIAKTMMAKHQKLLYDSATIIQSFWRTSSSRKTFAQKRCAAIQIQALSRGHRQRTLFSKQLMARNQHASIKLQSFCRTSIAKSTLKQRRKEYGAAIAIQSMWRTLSSRKLFVTKRLTATRIQALSRGHIQRNFYNRQLIARKCSSVIIQSFCRMILAKKICIKRRREHGAAIMIQSIYRTSSSRNKFIKQRFAAIHIQALSRGYIERKLYQAHLLVRERSSVLIQSLFRIIIAKNIAIKLRRENEAVTKIQSRYRTSSLRKVFAQQRSAATRIQALSRGHIQRKLYDSQMTTRKRNSSVILQAFCRMVISKRIVLGLRREHTAATRIQSTWRTSLARNTFTQQCSAATKIQATSRGHIQRNLFNTQLLTRKDSSIILQSFCRMIIAKRICIERRQQEAAAVMIQPVWRASLPRKDFTRQRSAATKIQASLRGYRQRNVFNTTVEDRENSSVVLQSFYRIIISKKLARRLRRQCEAAIVIQSIWRTSSSRNTFISQRSAATKIQASLRCHIQQKQYNAQRMTREHSSTILQSFCRMIIDKKKVIQLRKREEAAIMIESIWRMVLSRDIFLEQRFAAILIQAKFRSYRQQKLFNMQLHPQTRDENGSAKKSKELTVVTKDILENMDLLEDAEGMDGVMQYLREQIYSLQQENSTLKADIKDLEEDKRGLYLHAHGLQTAANLASYRFEGILKTNNELMSEVVHRREEIVDLKRKLKAAYEIGNTDNVLAERKRLERKLKDRQSVIKSLKRAANASLDTCKKEVTRLEQTLEKEREEHIVEVQALKVKVQKLEAPQEGYMEKLLDVLETTHVARESEVFKLRQELNLVTQQKDDEIKKLKKELDIARQQPANYSENVKASARDLINVMSARQDEADKEMNEIKRLMDTMSNQAASTAMAKRNFSKRSRLFLRSENGSTSSKVSNEDDITSSVRSLEQILKREVASDHNLDDQIMAFLNAFLNSNAKT